MTTGQNLVHCSANGSGMHVVALLGSIKNGSEVANVGFIGTTGPIVAFAPRCGSSKSKMSLGILCNGQPSWNGPSLGCRASQLAIWEMSDFLLFLAMSEETMI